MAETNDPWRLIRWNRRIMLGLPVLFFVGVAIGAWWFPELTLDDLWKGVGTPIVLGGWLLFFWPAPCPRCHRAFLIWTFPNWGYWVRMYFKMTFDVGGYLALVLNGPCPHCGLRFGADPRTG